MKKIIVLISLILFNSSISFSQKSNIEVKISLDEKTYNVDDDITLLFEVKNKSDKKYKLCKIQTPLEGFRGSFLKIIHVDTKTESAYIGPMVKRGKPTENDYVQLRSKKSINSAIKIKSGYKITDRGTYTIQFIGGYINQLPDSEMITFEIK